MHKLFRTKTMVSRLSLCVLYVLFFAVQLNLRYNSVEINSSGTAAYSVGKAASGIGKVSLKESTDRKASLTTRLNKRYSPGHFYTVQAPVLPSAAFRFISLVAEHRDDPFFRQQYHPFAQRRGPPAAC
ncbi:MAG: hypothetical protein DI535_00145 [Citrobacter freundii]|nr:MAG: hypothetical protein DI535_00145 [Citrobacter freundii]